MLHVPERARASARPFVLVITFINVPHRRPPLRQLRPPRIARSCPASRRGSSPALLAISVLVGLLWSRHLLVLHSSRPLAGRCSAGYALVWAGRVPAGRHLRGRRCCAAISCSRSRARHGLFLGRPAALRRLRRDPRPATRAKHPWACSPRAPSASSSASASGTPARSAWAHRRPRRLGLGRKLLLGTSDSGLVVQGHLYERAPAVAQQLLWSGGPTGPEGSLYVFPSSCCSARSASFRVVAPQGPRPFAQEQFRPD